jgi:hypothetical protein
MRIIITLFIIVFSQFVMAQEGRNGIQVVKGDLLRITPKLTDLRPDPNAPNQRDLVRDRYGLISMRGVVRNDPPVINDPTAEPKGEDPALQKNAVTVNRTENSSGTQRTEAIDVMQQFDGIGYTNVAPADPTMAIGPNHIIQMINGSSGSYFKIFNKSGTALNTQTYLDLLPGSGFFGQGDPIALYDQLANRFVLCEFGNITGTGNPTHLIMCVSQTPDPMGAWYVYRFATPGIFPDYPHWAVWNNAYYATTNDFNTAGTAFLGCSMWAFDRSKMLVGDASATALSNTVYTAPVNIGSNRSLAPVSVLGSTAPAANAPGMFTYYNEDALTAAADVDSIGFYTFQPDFTTPANTVIGRLPSLVVAPFKGNVCASRNCAPGCAGSSGYDVLSDRIMHHAYYRRFAGYDALTIQHTVDAGAVKAAARWYEFRNTGSGWSVNQQSTFSPDASFRFMPSMAINAAGQFCMGYNLSGGNACGSIAFTGRNSADPLNTMTYEETGATCGTGYGTFANRWGDYNDMNTDPAIGQDSIFWFTSMYGQANWNTRILKLKLTPSAQFDAKTEWVNFNGPGTITNLTCAAAGASIPGSFCNNSVIPYVLIRNKGLVPMTSVTIKYNDNGAVSSYPQTGLNIPVNGTQQFILPAYPAALGNHTVKAWSELPNGQPDPVSTNDTAYNSFIIITPSPAPVSYNFVPTTPFLPTGWAVVDPNNNNTWVRNANGNVNAGSAFIDNYNFNLTGQIDDIRTPPLSFGLTDSVVIEFDLAHKNFPGFNDRLQVLFSKDCGQTFIASSFDKSGAVLATAGASTANYTTPAATDWVKQRIALGGTDLSSGLLQIAFRVTNGFGNNIFIDNINITIKVDRDMMVSQINRPNTDECNPVFAPQVVVKNNGAQTVTSYNVNYRVGTGPITTIAINTPILPNATATHTFAGNTFAVGANQPFNAFTSNPVTAGGTGDQIPSNDLLAKNFTVRSLFTAPISEGFEGAAFAPAQWAIFNPDANNTWVRTAQGFNSGNSAFIDNYNFNLVGQIDDIRTPPVNVAGADSVIFSFDLAHKNFPGFDDQLSVGISNNCGASFLATPYSKAGAVLATAGASTANYTNPIQSDWRRERVAIGGAGLSTGNAIIALRCTNGYGNNIFIDNINIALRYKRDLQAVAVARPNGVECTGSFTPSFTVTNAGIETITGFTANYSINNGAPVTTNITGISLAANATATYTLTPVTGLPIGVHTIKMYSTNLITTGGTGDQFILNDTTSKGFNILGTQAAPLTQNFESLTSLPPANWGINNTDNNLTWSLANTGFISTRSASVQNYNYTSAAGGVRVDDLVTPNLTFSNTDSVFLSFDVAAITKNYPGSTAIPLDSLEVLVSKDCGNTFTTVFNKWGEDLQTVHDPNYPNTTGFTPLINSNWKNVKLNITAATGTSTTGLIVLFRNKSNNDNNIYIDNINLATLTFPARLKQQGYLLYPNPFSGSFTVQHYLPPTDLRYIEVIDAIGRLVYRKQYGNNGANSSEKIDLGNIAAGVYQVKLGYTNKQIVESIIKGK